MSTNEPTTDPPDLEAELLAAVRGVATGRIPWDEIASRAASLDPAAFVRGGHVDAHLVRTWAEENLPDADGPTLFEAEKTIARMANGAVIATPDLDPVDWSTSHASMEGLVRGWTEGDDDA